MDKDKHGPKDVDLVSFSRLEHSQNISDGPNQNHA